MPDERDDDGTAKSSGPYQEFGSLTIGKFSMKFVRCPGYIVQRARGPQHFMCDFATRTVYVSAHAPSNVMFDVLVHLLAMARLNTQPITAA